MEKKILPNPSPLPRSQVGVGAEEDAAARREFIKALRAAKELLSTTATATASSTATATTTVTVTATATSMDQETLPPTPATSLPPSPAAAAAMEATGDLPRAPDAGADPPPPLPGTGAAKPKAQRCLGLVPPPRPAAAASTAIPGASNGPAAAASISVPPATVPRVAAAYSRKRRPPRNPSAPRAKKSQAQEATASSHKQRRPAACLEPSPAPAASMEPEASSPAPVATGALVVLDEMPTSMDNDTFMNYTCGDALEIPSQEYTQEEVEVEGEGEGEGEPTPKRGRGTNFSLKEDQTLCNAWRRIGIDSIVGNEQQNSTYWDRIHELYKLLLKGDMARSAGSLQNLFHIINADCFKWSCCLAQVDRLNPSGTNAEDKLNVAQNLFMGKPKRTKKRGKLVLGRPFTLFHCWIILENDEKWKTRPSNEIPNKRKAPSSSVGDDFVVDSDDVGSSSPTPLSSVNRGRPEGRKKEKNKRANGDEGGYKQSLDNMMEVRKDIAMQRRELKTKEMEERRATEERKLAAEERRAAAEERRAAAEERLEKIEERKVAAEEMAKIMENEQRIMFMDPSGLDEKARAYLEIRRDQILASKGYYPNNGGI